MLAAMMLAAACAAPSPIEAAPVHQYLDAGVEKFLDAGGQRGLEQLLTTPDCARFTPVNGEPNFGLRDESLWLRFALRLDQPRDWRLVVRFLGLRQICVYWPLADGALETDCVDHGSPEFHQRAHQGRLSFPVPADYAPGAAIHLRAEPILWLKVPLELAPVDALADHEASSQYGWGLYYGLMGAIILVGGLLFLGRPDRAYLYFALHLGANTFGLGAWQGRFTLFDRAGFSSSELLPPAIALFLVFGALFYQSYLNTRKRAPRLHALLWVTLLAALALGIAQQFAPLIGIRGQALLAAVWVLLVLAAAWRALRQGFTPALWVLAAGAVLLAAVALNALSVGGYLLLGARETLQLAYLGNLVAGLFIVVGLVARVRRLARERDRAATLAEARQQLLIHRSQIDELTGLPNRARLASDLAEQLIGGEDTGLRRCALTIFSLNRFRAINHAVGYAGGDEVLKELAGRLRESAGADDLLARIGPSAFAWLRWMRDDETLQAAVERGEEMRCRLTRPAQSGQGTAITVSAGTAVFPDQAKTPDELLRYADEAFYRAKEDEVPGLRLFQPIMHQRAEQYLQTNQDLRRAVGANELELHFQPLCELQAMRPRAAEALLRWRHNGAYVPPAQFLPVAESADLLEPITGWVFREACRQILRWREIGLHGIPLYVNVSANQFQLPGFAGRVQSALADAGLPGSALVLEITEGMLVAGLDQARATLLALRECGVGIAVDDFGVGYSSLSYLRTLPVQSIKIDRSFLHGIPEETEAVSVIRAIIALARELKLTAIAEGIETSAQYEFLRTGGVDLGQGYHIARPMPGSEFVSWWRNAHADAA